MRIFWCDINAILLQNSRGFVSLHCKTLTVNSRMNDLIRMIEWLDLRCWKRIRPILLKLSLSLSFRLSLLANLSETTEFHFTNHSICNGVESPNVLLRQLKASAYLLERIRWSFYFRSRIIKQFDQFLGLAAERGKRGERKSIRKSFTMR